MIPNNKESREKHLEGLDPSTKVQLFFSGTCTYGMPVQIRNVDWEDPMVIGFVFAGPGYEEVTEEEDEAWQEAEKRMDVIGQNGNDGEHYGEIKAGLDHWKLPEIPKIIGEIDFGEDITLKADYDKLNVVVNSELKVEKVEVKSKYHHEIKPGVWVDVYDVLAAFNVTNPALQHLIKKALQAGNRGHKSLAEDLNDIVKSAERARELGYEG